jgi:hypothetical protein
LPNCFSVFISPHFFKMKVARRDDWRFASLSLSALAVQSRIGTQLHKFLLVTLKHAVFHVRDDYVTQQARHFRYRRRVAD